MSILIHHVTTELGVHHQVRVVDGRRIYAKPNSGLKPGDIVSHGDKWYRLYSMETGKNFDRFMVEELARDERNL